MMKSSRHFPIRRCLFYSRDKQSYENHGSLAFIMKKESNMFAVYCDNYQTILWSSVSLIIFTHHLAAQNKKTSAKRRF